MDSHEVGVASSATSPDISDFFHLNAFPHNIVVELLELHQCKIRRSSGIHEYQPGINRNVKSLLCLMKTI